MFKGKNRSSAFQCRRINPLKTLGIILIGLALITGPSALAAVQPSAANSEKAGLAKKVGIEKKPIQLAHLGLNSVEKMNPIGQYTISVLAGNKWQEAGTLKFDKFLREKELDLASLLTGKDRITLRLVQKGGGAAHIDAVTLGGMHPSEVTGSQDPLALRKLLKRDYDVLEAFGKSLELIFPANEKEKTLKHQGRTASCPTAPSQIPACGFLAPGSSELLASH